VKLVLQIAAGIVLGLLVWNWFWQVVLVLVAVALVGLMIWLVANLYNRWLGPRLAKRMIEQSAQTAPEQPRKDGAWTKDDEEAFQLIAQGEEVPLELQQRIKGSSF
jgi:hypothetical protein